MIEIAISEDQIKRAKELYEFGELNGSIMKGKSNIYGALGEILIFDFFAKDTPKFNSTYDYDMIIRNKKVDVKTKRTTVVPKSDYFCSISSFNTRQKCDFYFFVRVLESLKIGYLLGYISKKEFFKKAKFYNKGDADVNGFKFKDDCYNLEIGKLHEFSVDITKNLEEEFYYYENGKIVFTETQHLRRGFCCNNLCRHCPYKKK